MKNKAAIRALTRALLKAQSCSSFSDLCPLPVLPLPPSLRVDASAALGQELSEHMQNEPYPRLLQPAAQRERETPFQMELSAGNVNFLYKLVTSILFLELRLCLLFLKIILIPKRYIWGLHIRFPSTTPKYASLTYGLF